jgi:hypothetical protein
MHTVSRTFAGLLLALLVVWPGWIRAASAELDRTTLDQWAAPCRGWHYQAEHVIPARPDIPGHEKFHNPDVPCVYQLSGQPDKWCMNFIAFHGGDNSFDYSANGTKGRGIGLITSKPVAGASVPAGNTRNSP